MYVTDLEQVHTFNSSMKLNPHTLGKRWGNHPSCNRAPPFPHQQLAIIGDETSSRLPTTKRSSYSLALKITLPETNSSHLKIGHPNWKVVFQPSIFRCYVSFRECSYIYIVQLYSFIITIESCNYLSPSLFPRLPLCRRVQNAK